MPQDIDFGTPESPDVRPVATEQELLEFVNKGRAAGGANVLEALLPSQPNIATDCLIARGLNFSCEVDKAVEGNSWEMALPYNIDVDVALNVAKGLGLTLMVDGIEVTDSAKVLPSNYGSLYIELPEHIGNAAAAFDAGLAFQNFVEGTCDEGEHCEGCGNC